MTAHLNGPTDVIASAAAKTLPGLFRERLARSPDSIAYREWDSASGQWCDFSWRDMARLVARYQAALGQAGLEDGDRVAVQLPNGIDWVAFDIAAMATGLITVPLYTHDSLVNAAHILANSGAKLVLVDTWERWGGAGHTVFAFSGGRAGLGERGESYRPGSALGSSSCRLARRRLAGGHGGTGRTGVGPSRDCDTHLHVGINRAS